MNDNDIELQMILDDFNGVDDRIPEFLEYLLDRAEQMAEYPIVFSSPIIATLCIFKRIVDAFVMKAEEYETLERRLAELTSKTRSKFEAEWGADHLYIKYLERLKWK